MTDVLVRVVGPLVVLTWLALVAEAYLASGRASLVGRLVCWVRGHLWAWVTIDDLGPDDYLHVVRCRRCGARA